MRPLLPFCPAILIALAVIGCARTPTLNLGMSDQEILVAIGVNPRKTILNPEVVQGKDGTSTHYRLGTQTVTITRSMVSGMIVMASGDISGTWQLEKK